MFVLLFLSGYLHTRFSPHSAFPQAPMAGWSMFPSRIRKMSPSRLRRVSRKVKFGANTDGAEWGAKRMKTTTGWDNSLHSSHAVIWAGGPLLYEGVQLVQNSAALNGTQRVLLDHVLSEEECAELRQLAHVRTVLQIVHLFLSQCVKLYLKWFLYSCPKDCHDGRRRLQRQDVPSHSQWEVRRSQCA